MPISRSVKETLYLGEKFAKRLKKGDFVALIGDLGAGKTVLTKGIAKGLGVKNACYVNSPTFVIIKEYKGVMPLYHFDLYRLDHPGMLDAENFEEYFYGDGITVVEWADKVKKLLPKNRWEIRMSVAGEEKRKIMIARKSASGNR